MTTCVAPTNQTDHERDALRVLHLLSNYERDHSDVEFWFDVPHRQFICQLPSGPDLAQDGKLTLAIYNDLKISQYILEDDSVTTREKRRFTLTHRGRLAADRFDDQVAHISP